MRSEAVHLAECQPRLLELAEALRLPDPVVWTRACMAHGLPPPPELLTDGLDHIEEAFGIERTLEPLLARHRLLALAQSPIKNRQEVLRAVLEQDPQNPSWDEGLRLLDVARFKELRAEAKIAFRAHDRAALEKLANELEVHPPRAPLPDDLRDGLNKALNSVRLEEARRSWFPCWQSWTPPAPPAITNWRRSCLASGSKRLMRERWFSPATCRKRCAQRSYGWHPKIRDRD